jgi:hypothetical protein
MPIVEFDRLERTPTVVRVKSGAPHTLHAVCSSFVLRCYANVVIPLKPPLGPSMFGRGVAQPG